MRVEKVIVYEVGDIRNTTAFWKVSDKTAARPAIDSKKMCTYRTMGDSNVSVSRYFNYGCEIVKFARPLESKITSEAPKVVAEYKDFLDKADIIYSEFEVLSSADIQELA